MAPVVGDGDVGALGTEMVVDLLGPAMEEHAGPLVLTSGELDVLPGDSVGEAGAQGLQRGFLGREASRQALESAPSPAALPFALGEEPFEDPIPVSLDERPQAPDLAQIHSHSDDQGVTSNANPGESGRDQYAPLRAITAGSVRVRM